MEEEVRADLTGRYVIASGGDVYDPATGRPIHSPRALSGNALADRVSNGVTDPLLLTGQLFSGMAKGAMSDMAFG
ncbi:MAG: hypothetical protein SFX74_05075, partial [Fimbriimonadaceae bacterium]|nr:hypothetical protein [Fimbriimonadaceae bacterium]